MKKPSNARTREERQKKLAEALRANLRRRKSPSAPQKPNVGGNR